MRAKGEVIPMTKWQYRVLNLHEQANAENYANEHGREGWELVSVIKHNGATIMYFKRPNNGN